jgi:hypothetical protein
VITLRQLVLKLVVAAVIGTTGAIAGVGYGASDQPCDNNGCKSTTETVKPAGNSGGFTEESTQQNSTNSPNPNKLEEGPCTNPGGQTNCPHD